MGMSDVSIFANLDRLVESLVNVQAIDEASVSIRSQREDAALSRRYILTNSERKRSRIHATEAIFSRQTVIHPSYLKYDDSRVITRRPKCTAKREKHTCLSQSRLGC